MKQLTYILIGVFFIPVLARAGGKDSLVRVLPVRHKTRLVFNFDTRNSFIRGEKVLTLGAKLGLELHESWRIGMGIYLMPRPLFVAMPERIGFESIKTNNSQKILFNYFSVYTEYIWFKDRHWELSTPLALGFGNVRTWDIDSTGFAFRPLHRKLVLLLEPSLSGHYKVFSWVGIGAGVGYRHILGTDGHLNTLDSRFTKNFDSLFWNIRLKLFPAELIDVFKGRQKWWE